MKSDDPNRRAELLQILRSEGLDSVKRVFDYQGGLDINKPNLRHRRRTRLELTDSGGTKHVLYLKRYGRAGIGRRLWSLLTTGRCTDPAAIEFQRIRQAAEAGVPTMEAVDWGREDAFPAGGRSYIFVTAVPGEALARPGAAFWDRLAMDNEAGEEFTAALAGLVRTLHKNGYVHRDLYTSHIFLNENENKKGGGLQFHLIDLARMFRPRWRKFRWRVKDLAQLHYSMPASWVLRRWDDFLSHYLSAGDAPASRWRRAIERKSAAIRRREERKGRV